MSKKLKSRFGVTVDVNRDIPKDKYLALQQKLRAALTEAKLDPTKVQVYIHHLSISATEKHFQEGPLSRRMEHLTVNIAVPDEARRSRQISFLNHQIKIAYRNDIRIESRDFRMNYTLPGAHCEKHGEFDDYVALLVEPSCPEKLKKLKMTVTAHATANFRQKLINNLTGTAVTKIEFPLTQDIQLTF
jgi:hypothetical protein